ncbi:MAG: sugar-binding transcriptional regulator [Anaerolineaceae bacterium]
MDEKIAVLRDVAKYYYVENMTQAQIAQRMGLSRPKISRLLADARDKGIVKVFIPDMEENMTHLENQFLTLFKLQKVKVVPVPPTDQSLAFLVTCKEAAKYLANILDADDKIGVGWGGTLFEISKNMQHLSLPSTSIVQLFGNLDTGEADDYANDIVSQFASKLDSKSSHIIPCPVIVGNQIIVDILMHDDKVCQSINLAKSCNKMIVNIGLPTKDNCLYKGKYIKDDDLKHLTSLNAVGCIGCRFYDEDGNICDDQLNNRTIGVSLDDIKDTEKVITCVVGTHKARALLSAIKAGFLDIVIVDSVTAEKILEIVENEAEMK